MKISGDLTSNWPVVDLVKYDSTMKVKGYETYHCLVQIMQCSAKIEEAVADCVKHPDVNQCIMEARCTKIEKNFKPFFLLDSWS